MIDLRWLILKTEVLTLGLHAVRSKPTDYRVTLGGISVSSCAALKALGVIIDSSLSLKLMKIIS